MKKISVCMVSLTFLFNVMSRRHIRVQMAVIDVSVSSLFLSGVCGLYVYTLAAAHIKIPHYMVLSLFHCPWCLLSNKRSIAPWKI